MKKLVEHIKKELKQIEDLTDKFRRDILMNNGECEKFPTSANSHSVHP